jgi:hypothetical protein
MFLDAYAGGTMKIKTAEEVKELIDNMSPNEYHAHTLMRRLPQRRKV